MKGGILRGAARLRRASVYVLAMLAGLVAAWAVREHVQQRVQALEAEARTPMVSRLVAAYDLPAGTLLEEVHVAVREIPQPWAPGASVDPLELSSVLGATLIADVAHGEPFLRGFLSFNAPVPTLSSRLRAGQRALTVAAGDLGGLADMLRAGDSIDVYATFSHRQREHTVPVLQGMRVLTVANGVDGPGNVTLAATPDEALRFIAARQAGALTVMLRNRDDAAAVNVPVQGDLASLMGLDSGPRPAPGVSILYGDRLEGRAGFEAERP
ncbi:Flp pilus assembly protein CpaB [Achromobacter arsenitoxydans]|uniref:Flp pilus assembly protein CpaB n=1 Tax=Achromobacter arsenitoxydans SY8 TaxID=477184 RepID=H0FAC7_9BURK|nr:Flp pilus assembly protein CpaB [Achromobacter arsenitoxydans]EHK64758.1 Flp pilus assembly protein CpaB [Achromobacter arsenitoxydans SY8]